MHAHTLHMSFAIAIPWGVTDAVNDDLNRFRTDLHIRCDTAAREKISSLRRNFGYG